MKRKLIGIPGYKFKEDSFGAGIHYLNFLNRFADVRIIMPHEKYVKVDLLCLPGGLDTQPTNYKQVPGYSTSNQDVFKEYFFKNHLKYYVNKNTPIFGICLGLQELAVYFGCTLTQDLLFHATSTERWKTAHKVHPFINTGLIFDGVEYRSMDVNSHHHQALCEKGLTNAIIPLLRSENEDNPLTNDGDIVEAFHIHNKPIFAVQWHPEELYDPFSINVINYLLNINEQ